MWISMCISVAVFLFVIVLFSANNRYMGQRSEEWIFTDGFVKLYEAFFSGRNPYYVADKLGISSDKFLRNARILKVSTDIRKNVGRQMVGLLVLIISIIGAAAAHNIYLAVIGIMFFFFIGPYTQMRYAELAKQKRSRLREDLPRFIDIFQTALCAGLGIDSAIKVSAESIKCLVSDELLLADAERELGAKNWQNALEEIAIIYDVDVFSSFALNLITAYEKGISITETVERTATEIKQVNLLDSKERAARLANTILVPVMLFKILPLIALMLIPVMSQISAM